MNNGRTTAIGRSAVWPQRQDLRVFKQKQTPATARNTARSEITLGASTWASKNKEVSSVSGGCSSCIRLLPVGDSVLNRYSACVEPALLYAVTRSSYLVPLSRSNIENLDCGDTLFDTATELGSLPRETDRSMLRPMASFGIYFMHQDFREASLSWGYIYKYVCVCVCIFFFSSRAASALYFTAISTSSIRLYRKIKN